MITFPLVGKFRVVAAICSGVVIWPELGAVTVPTLESISAVSVAVTVALPKSAGSLWSAAVATAALDNRVTGAVLVWTGTMITGS